MKAIFRAGTAMRSAAMLAISAMLCAALDGCLNDDKKETDAHGDAQRLYVAHAGVLAAWNLETMDQVPGEITNLKGPTDMQALDDGTLLLNLTDQNQILIVDGKTMLERDRIPSSDIGGTRPVHSYLSPIRNGRRYWLTLNDGDGSRASNSARFIDVMPSSPTYLQAVGEMPLGIDHHKASFSSAKERVVISNAGDCDDVLSVLDYSDPAHIAKLATLSAAQAGWNDSTRICDPTYAKGAPPDPHGCATSKANGKAYCNLTGSGDIAVVDIDATPPTFSLLPTHGSEGGYTKAHPDGRYVYSLQADPREGGEGEEGGEGGETGGGSVCQVGQLVVIDAAEDSVVKELPLLYTGPSCRDSLSGTDASTAEPAHLLISADKRKLYVQLAGGWLVEEARVREQLVVDISDPADPVQSASLPIGTSTGYHGETLSGDGGFLFEANNLDGTVTQIDAEAGQVVKTISVKANPKTLATWGKAEGPGRQTGPIE